MKILLIDNDVADVDLVHKLLSQVDAVNYQLKQVGQLADAVRLLGEVSFDAVLLNLSLPDSAGVDTVAHLQDDAPQIPIVVLSAVEDEQTSFYALRIGAQDFLVKGELDGRSLLRSIRYAIERKRMQHLQARYHDQAALNSLVIAVSQSLQLEELLEIAVDKVIEITGCEIAYIRLRQPASGRIALSAHRGLTPERIDLFLDRDRPDAKRDESVRDGAAPVCTELMLASHGSGFKEPKDHLTVQVPLKAKGEVIGVLNVETRRRTSFAKRQLELLKAIGNVVGVGLENARLFTETRRQLSRIEALRDISAGTASSLDLSRVVQILIDKIVAVLPYSAIDIRLYDEASGELRPTASWKIDRECLHPSGTTDASGVGLSKLVFETKSPLAIRRMVDDPRTRRPELFRRLGLISYLGLPMVAHGVGVGVLSIYTKFDHDFGDEETRFLTALANQAGVAIHNSRLYERIRDQAAQLDRSNKVKDEFLSVMSHEFRTPLNVIMGYCDLMQKGGLGEVTCQQEQALVKITARSKALLSMLSTILEVTRIETEAVPLLRETFDLNEFLDDLKTAYGVRLERNVALEWQPADLAARVTTDREKLRLVVDQLLANAIQFTDSGKITVAASASADSESVGLAVMDTGVGIPAESQNAIFEKFTQLDGSSTRSHEGIGLGLYLVRRFIDLLGGGVTVKSQVGVGSVFQLTLPANSPGKTILTER